MRSKSFTVDIWARACFDPGTLTMASMGASLIGGGLSAAGTIAGGGAAAEAGKLQKQADYAQATELDQNATQAIASGQRQALEVGDRVRQTMSTAKARGAGSGFATNSVSQLDNTGQIAKRGSYMAAIDMFNGESTATALRNQAEAKRFEGDVAEKEGEAKQTASLFSAAGTIAGSAGSMAKTYGDYRYPTAPRGAYG